MLTLSRREPFVEIDDLHNPLDRLVRLVDGGQFSPAIDVVREDDCMKIRADVPGIKPDEVKIKAEDGMLTISGEHTETKEEREDGDRYVRRERHFGSFSRSMTLPEGVDPEKIAAKTSDGVLEVIVPLDAEHKKKVVEIKAEAG